MRYIISDIKLPFWTEDDEIIEQAQKRMKSAGCYSPALKFGPFRRSIDARKKDNILSVSSVVAECDADLHINPAKASQNGITVLDGKIYDSFAPIQGNEKLNGRPLVVGMGPAGLFCSLMLAENGYAPILIDRGDCVADRVKAVENFYSNGTLDTESNIQFGEGGAGTFSDGKLVTRINDPRCRYVLKKLKEAGAPEDILVKAKPHIGTDVLRSVVSAITARIRLLGGDVLYRCRLDGIRELPDGSICASTGMGDIMCGALVLATGHSARELYEKLLSEGFSLTAKSFSVGVRVEHLKKDIDSALYGKFAGHPKLGPGEYNLSDTTGKRGVYTFCMCPGGEVVAATSEREAVVVNGMSNHARSGRNANCATAVSVTGDDVAAYMSSIGKYTDPVSSAIEFQRTLEQRAYNFGGGSYCAPIQLMGDFLEDTLKSEPHRIMPTYMGDGKCRIAMLSDVLPGFVTEQLKYGFHSFEKKLKGFAVKDAVLTAVESRTTSPVRILRTDSLNAPGHPNVFPCGEGAGYAGGITSAAVDGIRCAEAIVARFKA